MNFNQCTFSSSCGIQNASEIPYLSTICCCKWKLVFPLLTCLLSGNIKMYRHLKMTSHFFMSATQFFPVSTNIRICYTGYTLLTKAWPWQCYIIYFSILHDSLSLDRFKLVTLLQMNSPYCCKIQNLFHFNSSL